MHKHYKHPAPVTPDHGYQTGLRVVDDHIKRVTAMGNVSPEQADHLGGLASYHDHLQEMYHGEAHAIKLELKRVIDYLYYYTMTGHDIYKFLAEDALKHVDQLHAVIEDEDEKTHAEYFLDEVREYMECVKPMHMGDGTVVMPQAQTYQQTY